MVYEADLPAAIDQFKMYEYRGYQEVANADTDPIVWMGATPPLKLLAMSEGMTLVSVVADGANNTSTFKTDATESSNNYFNDMTITVLTGTNKGQTKKIAATSGYNGSTKFFTLETGQTFDAAFSAGDILMVYGRIN